MLQFSKVFACLLEKQAARAFLTWRVVLPPLTPLFPATNMSNLKEGQSVRLPIEIIQRIHNHSDFFSQLYIGTQYLCVCQFWQWIARNRQRDNVERSYREITLLCQYAVRRWYDRRRIELRKTSPSWLDYWRKKNNSAMKMRKGFEIISRHSMSEDLLSLWRNLQRDTEYRTIRDWKEEGILLMCVYFNLKRSERSAKQDLARFEDAHLDCFRHEILRYVHSQHIKPLEEFEQKKNF